MAGIWAFNSRNPGEFPPMGHARAAIGRSRRPQPGDTIFTNRHSAILTLAEDTSAGAHAPFFAACDVDQYQGTGDDVDDAAGMR
jgi:hypothetical protein